VLQSNLLGFYMEIFCTSSIDRIAIKVFVPYFLSSIDNPFNLVNIEIDIGEIQNHSTLN
jgi:hypothetical protein